MKDKSRYQTATGMRVALELRLNHARATKDVDLSLRALPEDKGRNMDPQIAERLQSLLQDCVGTETGDFFEFVIGQAVLDLVNAPYGGTRFPVEARLAGRIFGRFHVDVALGDLWLEPHEWVLAYDWFSFAGIPPPKIPLISREQQFAEKLHAYTIPRATANSRVKDLVDMVLLIDRGGMDPKVLGLAIARTFARRRTHPLTLEVPDPPGLWQKPFRTMAERLGLPGDIAMAMDRVRTHLQSLARAVPPVP